MQRQYPIIPQPTTSNSVSNTLEAALTVLDDEESFYTASLQFLTRKLQEKTHNTVAELSDISKSCCNLSKIETVTVQGKELIRHKEFDPIPVGSSLSMHQVLPFPKSSKDGFFSRFKNTFRKYRRGFSLTESTNSEELQVSKSISNFKFPRCARMRSVQSSCLMQIKEEISKEYISNINTRDDLASSSKGDVSKQIVKNPINR